MAIYNAFIKSEIEVGKYKRKSLIKNPDISNFQLSCVRKQIDYSADIHPFITRSLIRAKFDTNAISSPRTLPLEYSWIK